MATFTVTVNGRQHIVHAAPDMPLLWVLRDLLQLTGTKYGCGAGVCGACTIHKGRAAVRSCQIPISAAQGESYTTIEGLSAAVGQAFQEAWIAEDVSQCGYCQAGMIMTASALLSEKSNPTGAEIDAAFSASICRCGTYSRIRRAIERAAGVAGKRV